MNWGSQLSEMSTCSRSIYMQYWMAWLGLHPSHYTSTTKAVPLPFLIFLKSQKIFASSGSIFRTTLNVHLETWEKIMTSPMWPWPVRMVSKLKADGQLLGKVKEGKVSLAAKLNPWGMVRTFGFTRLVSKRESTWIIWFLKTRLQFTKIITGACAAQEH